jgi:sulfur dioxygenase
MFDDIIFRQLFDAASSTYTYVVGDPQSLQAVIIDTVFEQHFRDRALVEELGLKLRAVLMSTCSTCANPKNWRTSWATSPRLNVFR